MALLRMVVVLAGMAVFAVQAYAADWKSREVEDAGFSMLAPKDAKSESLPEGWRGLSIKHKGLALMGIAKDGVKVEEIEAEVSRLSGMHADSIEIDDEGKGDGWKWYKSIYASQGGRVLLGIYGEAEADGDDKKQRGYIFLLLTTEDDFDTKEDLYYDWFESIQIY